MNHWLVVPVVLPAFVGPLIVLLMRHDLVLQRVVSVAATVAKTLVPPARTEATPTRSNAARTRSIWDRVRTSTAMSPGPIGLRTRPSPTSLSE